MVSLELELLASLMIRATPTVRNSFPELPFIKSIGPALTTLQIPDWVEKRPSIRMALPMGPVARSMHTPLSSLVVATSQVSLS